MTESALRDELGNLPAPLRIRLEAAGFDAEGLVELAAPLFARARGDATASGEERNRIRGLVEPPRAGDIKEAPAPGSAAHEQLAAVGLETLRRGELAFCVMAGGMATRMGGGVKALVDALDGQTFLDLRLRENAAWSERGGSPGPLGLMTRDATHAPIREPPWRAVDRFQQATVS